MAGTISTLGLGSGIDLAGMLDKLKAVDKIPIVNKQAKQVEYKNQLAEFDTVNTKLLAVKTAAFNLSLNDTFDIKSTSSNNVNVLTASGSSSAAIGSYDLTVTSLAKKNSWQTSGVAAKDSIIATAAGTFAYTVNGKQTSIDVNENMTLEQLVAAINDDENNPGVTAMTMDDGSGGTDAFHLVLVSNETGENNAVTIDTNNTDLTFNEIQATGTLNAQFTLNGISYQRGSNSIDDVIDGVTLNLRDTGTAVVTVKADTESISEKISALVEAYNDAIQEIETNSSYDTETNQSGALSGISIFTGIKSQLNSILFGSVSGLSGTFNSLIDIGFEYNRDGTISIDEEKLTGSLTNNLESVQELFAGTTDNEVEGIASQLNDQLTFLTKYNGLIDLEEKRVQSTIDRLDNQIELDTARLDSRYETMAKVFAQLDEFMNNMESQGTALTQQFNSLNNLFTNKQ